MKTCPDCQAPNPERLSKCYACGVRLDARSKAAPLPGEGTYPCANCDGAIPQHLKECPHCGRLAEKPQEPARTPSPMRVVEPPGWKRADLPDGTVRLVRRAGGRAMHDFSAWLGGASAATYLLGFGLATVALRLHTPMLVSIALVPCVGVFGVWIAWWGWGREEIRIGPNWLERRLGLGRWERKQRLTHAALVVRPNFRARRFDEHFDLIAIGRGGTVRLESGSIPLRTDLLFGTTHSSGQLPAELVFLTEVIAQLTGWSVTQSR